MGDLFKEVSESQPQTSPIERREVPYMCGQMSAKIDGLEKALKLLSKKSTSQGKALGRVERKVFNGFGDKISHMERMIERNRVGNECAHTELKDSLRLFAKFGATSLILIFISLLAVLGSVWLQDRISNEKVEEVPINALADPPTETP
jgi:hypothetical protein